MQQERELNQLTEELEQTKLTPQDVLTWVYTRNAVRSLAKRPTCPHRKLALQMAALGAPRFVTLPWWQQPNPETGEEPEGLAVANRHERRAWYARRKSRKASPAASESQGESA